MSHWRTWPARSRGRRWRRGATLTTAGLDPAQQVVTYGGGGHYGALEEWTSDASNPVESVP
jgi:3-mercaptopyruvate sulfurtransferase SseA